MPTIIFEVLFYMSNLTSLELTVVDEKELTLSQVSQSVTTLHIIQIYTQCTVVMNLQSIYVGS